MLMMLFLTLRPESLSKHKKGDDDYDYDASRMLELDDNKDQMLEEDNTRIPTAIVVNHVHGHPG